MIESNLSYDKKQLIEPPCLVEGIKTGEILLLSAQQGTTGTLRGSIVGHNLSAKETQKREIGTIILAIPKEELILYKGKVTLVNKY